MKQFIILLTVVLLSNYLYSQQFPTGSWTIVTDNKGNAIDAKNNGARQVTSFDFTDGRKYSFLYQEFDEAGHKIIEVIENGIYSLSASKFVLTPSTSTTTYFEYLAQSAKPISNTVKQNPTAPAEYNWSYQSEGNAKLIIEALNPGYREGYFSAGKTKSAVNQTTRKSTPLSAVRPTVRSL